MRYPLTLLILLLLQKGQKVETVLDEVIHRDTS